jgi:hypothetical protein
MLHPLGERIDQRSKCWYGWYQDARSDTYQNPTAIRDKWNQLSNAERRRIAPQAWQRIGLGVSGREMVTKSLRKVKKPMQI